MKILRYKSRLALILSVVTALNMFFGFVNPPMESFAYTERAATINASSLNVRSDAGTNHSVVGKLTHGSSVTVTGEKNSAGQLWYQIRFNASGTTKTGYVLSSYIKFPVTYTSDSDFEAYLNSQGFPESYKGGLRQLHAQYPNWVFTALKVNDDWESAIRNESIVGVNLVEKGSISSWKSIAEGAYNWDTSSWPGFDSNSWVAASEGIIRYYMDPRNFLDETYIFQFLLHRYDSKANTREGMESMVSGTFLAGTAPGGGQNTGNTGGSTDANPGSGSGSGSVPDAGSPNYGPGFVNPGTSGSGSQNSGNNSSDGVIGNSAPTKGYNSDVKLEGPSASISKRDGNLVAVYGPGMDDNSGSGAASSGAPSSGSNSYVDIILNAGAKHGVNPYVLAAMMIQEQGTTGSGRSISGTEPGYEGYYNFYNIGAYQSGSLSPVQKGLQYASSSGSYGRPWNSVERSIQGGAEYYASSYVNVGQDTFYLKKYNVQGNNLYKHQYMTNVQGAAGEGAKLSKAYTAAVKQTALEFKIPVYANMPDSPSPKPTGDGSPNNKLSSLSIAGFNLTPTFSKDTMNYDLIVDPSVSSITVQATAINSSASVSGTGQIQLLSGNNVIKVSVQAQNGSIREYTLNVVRQQNGQTGKGADGSVPGGADTSDGSGTSPGGSGVTIVP